MATHHYTDELRVLFVAASLISRDPLDTDKEFELLQTKLEALANVNFRVMTRATAEALHDKLLTFEPHIVHLAVHGTAAGPTLDDGYEGKTLPARILEELLRQTPSLRCVVLNACYSADWFPGSLGPALIMMREEVGDEAAIAFSEGFYSALAKGASLPAAFDAGKLRAPMRFPGEPFQPGFMPECHGVLGVRSHVRYHPRAQDRCRCFCDLGEWLDDDGRKDWRPDWQGAGQALREQLQGAALGAALAQDGEHMIHLDCPGTIATLSGWLLGPQARVDPLHRLGNSGHQLWRPDRSLPPPRSSPWAEDFEPCPGASTLVVAVSVSNDVLPAVRVEIGRRLQPTHCLHLTPVEGVSQQAIRDADHALACARDLARRLHHYRFETGAQNVELFFSGPNALLFLLGQQGVAVEGVLMNEFDRARKCYTPSLRIG